MKKSYKEKCEQLSVQKMKHILAKILKFDTSGILQELEPDDKKSFWHDTRSMLSGEFDIDVYFSMWFGEELEGIRITQFCDAVKYIENISE